MLVERDPHQLIEGIVITAFAIQCHHAFIYLRGEFALGAERLGQAHRRGVRHAASSARTSSAPASTSRSSLHRGAGCYIAGDETGLLSSLEGERAMPRIKPPFPAVQGVYAAPTIVNNVETMSTRAAHHPHAAASGTPSMGVEPLHRHAHLLGVGSRRAAGQLRGRARHDVPRADLRPRRRRQGGKQLGFFIPGGASSPWLIDEHLDAPLDMDYGAERAQDDARVRARSWSTTTPSTRCSSRGASRSSSPTSRAASARRAARARAGSRRCSTGCRTATAVPRTSTCCSASATTSRRACRGRRA